MNNAARSNEVTLNHFAKVELAEKMQFADLVDKHLAHCASFVPVHAPCADNLMCPLLFKSRLLKSKHGKAAGVDGVVSELVKRDLNNFARLYYPLHVKIALTGIGPLSFGGAMAFTVRKKGPAAGTMADFRSVLLQNFVAKSHYALLRTRLYALFH